ncbi:HD-GYP domain-containing protein [Oceanospirillum sanctuarii]|uniref:HD-GYP domain-containing protein n=1 Tax=Oceanospirillum sanctuarii TaxID=1434821 RepID=UPI000A39E988|nr:HD-GYP domain-containing protein [Oceanospirillum sanctuarii]
MQFFPSQWQVFQQQTSLEGKLVAVAEQLQTLCADVERFSVAVYDEKTDMLKTYYSTSHADEAITRYQARLNAVPSLKQLSLSSTPRVINDLSCLSHNDTYHTQALLNQGWRSSCTLPMRYSDSFMGFIFFNSRKPDVFVGNQLIHLELIGQLITMLVHDEIAQARTLKGAVQSALALSCGRDEETGQHLERMGYYSRIIAHHIAGAFGFDDHFVEQVFQFAPVHDLGKIAIPDSILLKPGKLTEDEYREMQTHTVKGAQMLEDVFEHHGIQEGESSRILRHIVLYHHEMCDGSGYPYGLTKDDIPLEARIVAVADIFDALTSRRPYKEPWSNEKALATLQEMAEKRLCPECVQALADNMDEVRMIQQMYEESLF